MARLGKVYAQDGWTLEYDLRSEPHRIDVCNAEDVKQYRISGDIPQRYLDREIRQFLGDHAAQQMVMEW